MIIDMHSHFNPPHFRSAGNPPYMFDLEGLLSQQEQAGVDISVISNPMITIGANRLDLLSFENLKAWNEFACELNAKTNGRTVAFAGTNPFGGDEYIKEVERAIRQGGLKGISINTNVNGEYIDSDRAFPLYDLACELDMPIFVHPPTVTVGFDKLQNYRMVELVGRPCDTTIAFARMILFGVLERYPKLKIIAAHMGGALMMLPGRLDFGYDLRKDDSFGPWGQDLLSKPPSEYISQIYVDTMGFHAPGVMCAVGTVGVDHVLFGSDFPPVPVPLKHSADLVRNLPLTRKDREKILGGNAAGLLKLP